MELSVESYSALRVTVVTNVPAPTVWQALNIHDIQLSVVWQADTVPSYLRVEETGSDKERYLFRVTQPVRAGLGFETGCLWLGLSAVPWGCWVCPTLELLGAAPSLSVQCLCQAERLASTHTPLCPGVSVAMAVLCSSDAVRCTAPAWSVGVEA